MTLTEIKDTAARIVKTIKGQVMDRKKICEKNPYADRSVYVEYDSEYDRKVGKYVPYIRVGNVYFRNLGTDYDIQQITNESVKGLEELKKVRGYKNLVYCTKTYREGGSYWDSRKVTELDRVQLLENPCKDFKAIQSFVQKYGNITLPDFKLYSAHMGGKRGVLWGEEGDRIYLANKEKKCARIISELRKARGSKDIVSCKFGEEDYIDPVDQRYSAYHEVECDGEKRCYLEITVKTPTGKVKYESKIY